MEYFILCNINFLQYIRVSQPLVIRELVRSFHEDSQYTLQEQYLLAGGVVVATFLITMFFHPSFHFGFIAAMR